MRIITKNQTSTLFYLLSLVSPPAYACGEGLGANQDIILPVITAVSFVLIVFLLYVLLRKVMKVDLRKWQRIGVIFSLLILFLNIMIVGYNFKTIAENIFSRCDTILEEL